MLHRSLRTATAMALVLSAHSAAALTPEEAWAHWQALATGAGQTLTAASTARAGDTLTVSGITAAFPLPDGPTITATLPEVAFRDLGDGTVEIAYPPAYTMTFAFPDGMPDDMQDGPKSFALDVAQDQVKVIASGAADAPSYDLTAASVALTARDFIDQDDKPVDINAQAALTGISGRYTSGTATAGAPAALDSALSVKGFSLTVDAKDPETATTVAASLSAADISSTGKTVMVDPLLLQSGNMSAALAAGFKVDGSFASGPVTLSLDVDEGGTKGAFDGTFTGASAHARLDADRLDYGFGLTGAQMSGSGADMPLPEIASAFGELTFGFAMPVRPSDQPQDFAVLARFVDFTMTEDVWAIFDPGQRLKRDPVSLIVDVAGTGAWTVDILDPATQMESGPDLPAKLFTFDLKEVLARAAGAQVVATGGLTFDNDNLQTYAGFPEPSGKVNVTMDGINALMDALVAIGVVPEEDMMGARMGLAMFAKPGANPDQLVSEIEFRDGGLFVNGMQMF
jgi:hypothetical protein